jgi:hypothetical protein
LRLPASTFAVRFEAACFVVTHDIAEEAMPWLKRAREIFGRLVVVIDAQRALPGALKRAKAITPLVHSSDSPTFFGSDFRGLLALCESDWTLFLDYDEELSAEWDDEGWRKLIRQSEFTHFYCARRWIVPNGNYITSGPWWPDLQLRLFRSDLVGQVPRKPHEVLSVLGQGALLRNLAIHHHVLRLSDRSTRQAKTQVYDTLLPGGALEYFYLYEDFHPHEAAVTPPAKVKWDEEILSMPRLAPENARADILAVENAPGQVRRADLFWIDVTLRNETGIPISSAPPFPVRLSYHWWNAATAEVALYDGLRTELLPPLDHSQSASFKMVVHSPPQPGSYVLHLTLVQEQNFWFEQVAGQFGREITIEVI